MTPTPVAIGLTLCERVIVEEGTRNLTLVSTFVSLRGEEFPFTPAPFSVVATFTGGRGSGILTLAIKRLETDEDIGIWSHPIIFSGRLSEVRALLRLTNCTFPAPGMYQVMFLVDEEFVAHRRIAIYS